MELAAILALGTPAAYLLAYGLYALHALCTRNTNR